MVADVLFFGTGEPGGCSRRFAAGEEPIEMAEPPLAAAVFPWVCPEAREDATLLAADSLLKLNEDTLALVAVYVLVLLAVRCERVFVLVLVLLMLIDEPEMSDSVSGAARSRSANASRRICT